MSRLTVTYKAGTVITLNASGTKVLKCKNALMEDDVTIDVEFDGAPTFDTPTIAVTSAGVMTAAANGQSNTYTLSSTDDADFVAANIKYNIGIFGVTGSFTGDGNVTAAQMLSGAIGYAKGQKITGSIVSKTDSGNTTLTPTAATKSFAAGYYANAHGATVPVYDGTIE